MCFVMILSILGNKTTPLAQFKPAGWFSNLLFSFLASISVIARCSDGVDRAQFSIQQPRADSGIHFFQRIGRADDCWQFRVIAIVEELIEFLAHPRRHGLRSSVIE